MGYAVNSSAYYSALAIIKYFTIEQGVTGVFQ